MRTNVIIVDLDGTLFNDSHRRDYAQAKQWEEYHSRCASDPPNLDVLALLMMLSGKCSFIAITGRTEKWRTVTEQRLLDVGAPIDALYMRRDDDYRKAEEIKLEYIANHFGSLLMAKQRVLFCLEDSDKVVEAYRNAGLPTYQVRPGGN